MGAIVRVTTTSDEAWKAFVDVIYADDAIRSMELGVNSGIHEVVFSSSAVAIGTGFATLQRLMNDHSPGTGDELVPVPLG